MSDRQIIIEAHHRIFRLEISPTANIARIHVIFQQQILEDLAAAQQPEPEPEFELPPKPAPPSPVMSPERRALALKTHVRCDVM